MNLTELLNARVYDLEQPRHAGLPIHPAHEPGVSLTLHRRHERDAAESRTGASALLVMAEHTGTHIDALCHQAYDGELHGGVKVTPAVQTTTGFTELGIDTVEPIVRRGVLFDVAPCSSVGPAELEACGVEVRPGDVALVRFGSGALFGDPDNVAWDAIDATDPEPAFL